MTGVSGMKDTSSNDAGPATRRAGSLPAAAQAYVGLVAAAAAAASLSVLPQLRFDSGDLLVFAILSVGAALGSVLIVSTERNHGFNTALVFIAAAVILLPPPLIALMGLAQYWPDLIRRRYPWYTQLFNLANYTLNALAAWGALHLVMRALPGQRVGHAMVAAAACVVLVGSNHLLVAWDAPARSARPASSRGRASRPISCSPPSASRSPAFGSGTPTCCRSRSRRSS